MASRVMDLNANGVSSRRFACDRCRGQKLRCIRERTDQQNCDRCFRADAECRTSPVFRGRSYVGDTAFASTKSIEEKARVQKSVRKRRYNNAAQLQMQSQATTQQAVIDTAIVTETASSPGSLGQTALMNIFESSQSSLPVPMYPTGFSDTMSDMNWAAEDALFSGLILPDGTDQTFDLSDNSGTSSSTEAYPSKAQTYTGDPPSRPTPSLILSPRTTSSTSTSNLQNIECSSHKTLATTFENNASCESPEGQVAGTKTNLDIGLLLSQIDKDTPTAIVEMLVEPIIETKSSRTRLDDILNGTRDFLQALSLLVGSSGRHPTKSPRSSTGTVLSSNPTSNTKRPDLQKSNKDYAHTLSRTDAISTSSPVDKSGNLQTPILIQIITSLFEQIERLLGLPREHWIYPGEIGPDGFVSGGLLSSEEMVGIVNFAFWQQESGESESRRGVLEALCKHLEGLKQLLKDSIAP
ncbi:uncharacterized protein EAE98_005335 [Botrytis deweyae]|uniref:Zn(2)-C6 fungal-type domain-containing protein n=1 Tax=Botrytis deweyae TaxID=2478750 RepID=A0ABQ7INL0_9HELO|nr:uncharacterized protein EAE98_005335 [Botrytis deweyae]KAF7929417.1 hypothetical protein EAE98_005335 [Botrytis deweyae]